MIAGKSILGVIIARGGSKGIPRKSIRPAGGKPLIAWTIEEAKKSRYIDRLILSSEDPEIIVTAQQWGCDVPFVRPAELAQDHNTGVEPLIHAVETLPGFDFSVLLQPTSPFRSVDDIDGSLAFCIEKKARSCATITEVDKPPYWMFTLDECQILKPVIPGVTNPKMCRQALPKTYAFNGAVFICETSWLLTSRRIFDSETLGYYMPKERSLDIDSEIDWLVMEEILKRKSHHH